MSLKATAKRLRWMNWTNLLDSLWHVVKLVTWSAKVCGKHLRIFFIQCYYAKAEVLASDEVPQN